MSELSAFLADHDLEELEDILHDNGMERIMDLSGMDQSDIEALGEDVRARVEAQTGILLQWEIERIGSHEPLFCSPDDGDTVAVEAAR